MHIIINDGMRRLLEPDGPAVSVRNVHHKTGPKMNSSLSAAFGVVSLRNLQFRRTQVRDEEDDEEEEMKKQRDLRHAAGKV